MLIWYFSNSQLFGEECFKLSFLSLKCFFSLAPYKKKKCTFFLLVYFSHFHGETNVRKIRDSPSLDFAQKLLPRISDFWLLHIWAEISRETKMGSTNEESVKQLRALMEDGVCFLFLGIHVWSLLCLKDRRRNFTFFELTFVVFWQLMIHWESRIGLVIFYFFL